MSGAVSHVVAQLRDLNPFSRIFQRCGGGFQCPLRYLCCVIYFSMFWDNFSLTLKYLLWIGIERWAFNFVFFEKIQNLNSGIFHLNRYSFLVCCLQWISIYYWKLIDFVFRFCTKKQIRMPSPILRRVVIWYLPIYTTMNGKSSSLFWSWILCVSRWLKLEV